MGLTELAEISRYYGADPHFVLAGGGNTSYKEGNALYVKASGFALARITEEGFVRMQRDRLAAIWERRYPVDPDKREQEALADLMSARADGQTLRPSVETLLHDLLPQRYVVHTHPALVNGLTCSQAGPDIAEEIFGSGMLWVPTTNPGYILAREVRSVIRKHTGAGNSVPPLIFLQNHGVFVAADSVEEIKRIYDDVFSRISARVTREPERAPGEQGEDVALPGAPGQVVRALSNPEIARQTAAGPAGPLSTLGYTPDHIVYCRSTPAWLPVDDQGPRDGGGTLPAREAVEAAVADYTKRYGQTPRIFARTDGTVWISAESRKVADSAAVLFADLLKILAYSESFGGPLPMPEDQIEFIRNWEVERFRAKISTESTE